MRTPLFLALIAVAMAACQPAATPPDATATETASAPVAVTSQVWTLPTPPGAAQPDLVATQDGDLLLSWIEPDGDGHALAFARFADGRWSEPQAIARGDDWFVNWADTPHVAATPDGALWAHWLQKSAAEPYAYDVALVRSPDRGATWSDPLLVNDDGTPTEHGFVSLWPVARDRVGIAWLDGRAMTGSGHGAHSSHGGGMMTLRSAQFDAGLQRSRETRIDASTCDCCQTDVAATARGPLLVYRDRTASEIRDIYAVRLDGEAWGTPQRVHADDWTMPACPVNGPSVDARGETVVVGWYTAAGGTPQLELARSNDAGASFGAPVKLDAGTALQGRIDVALDDDAAWAAWMREDAGGQSLQLARFTPDLSRELQRIEIARLQGRGRATGFPQLVLHDGVGYVVWTDIVAGQPRLMGAALRHS